MVAASEKAPFMRFEGHFESSEGRKVIAGASEGWIVNAGPHDAYFFEDGSSGTLLRAGFEANPADTLPFEAKKILAISPAHSGKQACLGVLFLSYLPAT